MKADKLMLLFAAALLLLAAVSCSNNKGGRVRDYLPEWWNQQDGGEFVYGYGLSNNSASKEMSIEAARQTATGDLAQYVKVTASGMAERFGQEAGVDKPQVLAFVERTGETLWDELLKGVLAGKTEIYKVDYNGEQRYETFLQVRMPAENIDKALYGQIRNEEALYNEFKASQSFKRLEEKLQKQKEN